MCKKYTLLIVYSFVLFSLGLFSSNRQHAQTQILKPSATVTPEVSPTKTPDLTRLPQTTATPSQACPSVFGINTPSQVKPGEIITFDLAVNENGAAPVYNWTVSGGRLVRGQGEKSFTVISDLQNGFVKVNLQLDNINPLCSANRTFSQIVEIRALSDASLINSYNFNGENAKSTNEIIADVVAKLDKDPTAKVALVGQGGENGTIFVEQKLLDIKQILVKDFNVDRNRIITDNVGLSQEKKISFYYVPLGAALDPVPETDQTTITGTVKDEAGKLITWIKVYAQKRNDDYKKYDLTPKEGRYLIRPIGAGEYDVTVEAKGYVTKTIKAEKVKSQATVRAHFVMQAAPPDK